MTYADDQDYRNGHAAGSHVSRNYGVRRDDVSALERNRLGYSQAYRAGFADAMIDYVQTREELAPGCYRVRALGGAE